MPRTETYSDEGDSVSGPGTRVAEPRHNIGQTLTRLGISASPGNDRSGQKFEDRPRFRRCFNPTWKSIRSGGICSRRGRYRWRAVVIETHQPLSRLDDGAAKRHDAGPGQSELLPAQEHFTAPVALHVSAVRALVDQDEFV